MDIITTNSQRTAVKKTLVTDVKAFTLVAQCLAQCKWSKTLDGDNRQMKNANTAVKPIEFPEESMPWKSLLPQTGRNHRDRKFLVTSRS